MNGSLQGKRVLVMGLARSGRAAATLAAALGAQVVAIDLRTDLPPLSGVTLDLGPHRRERFTEADTIVVSPGIPAAHPELARAIRDGQDVVGELGFALRFLSVPVLAITGTNGKSTTTHFAGQLARASGFRPFVGGNLGTPLSEVVLDGSDPDLLVLEVSSYQLELPGTLKPRVGVILNLTPDHLARHGTMEGYAAAKARLFERMDETDLSVLPVGDERLVQACASSRSSRAWFGAHPGVVRSGRSVQVELAQRSVTYDLGGFGVPGAHNLDNAAAAALLLTAFGADPGQVQAALPALAPLPHRMQIVADTHGVAWVNDSKATNVDAARVGVEGVDRPAVVLLGGQGKRLPDGTFGFGALAPSLARHRAVITFGQDGEAIGRELAEAGCANVNVPTLREAIEQAARSAHNGDWVLLSPGCASFDEFRDFEHRGEQFALWVRERFG